MKLLWLTNIPLPEANSLLGEKSLPFGGWLVNSSIFLSSLSDVELSIAFPKDKLNSVQILRGEEIIYYAFPIVKYKRKSLINNNNNNAFLSEILDKAKPDVVHIFGTEFPHTLSMVNACNKRNIKVVVSIQGLVSIIAKHYMLNLPCWVQKRYTLRDFVKQSNIKLQQKKFIKKGELEKEALRKVKYVIGRTTWDKVCTLQINPQLNYYFCNESLREEFYNNIWSLSKCEKYSIFVSQGSYPIKGLHIMIEALYLIQRKIPEVKLYVGGNDITKSNTIKEKMKISSYGKYIKELIKKHSLQDKIIFTGLLDEVKMTKQFLKSHVFVSPSTIENSPNSLGEAMILGVPCVVSNVGGVPDMLKNKEEGFIYQADAPYMLAHYVCKLFNDNELALRFSKNAREHALKTHDLVTNTNRLLQIYENILQKKE